MPLATERTSPLVDLGEGEEVGQFLTVAAAVCPSESSENSSDQSKNVKCQSDKIVWLRMFLFKSFYFQSTKSGIKQNRSQLPFIGC